MCASERFYSDAASALAEAERMFERKEFGEVVRVLSGALERFPSVAALYHNRGGAFAALKRFPAALADFSRAAELSPQWDASLTQAGSALREMGRIDEAIEMHRRALRVNPGSALAWFNLGNALQVKGEIGAAVDAYAEADRLKQDWPELLHNLSHLLLLLERFREAIPVLLRLLRLCPDSPVELAKLASALREANRPGDALDIAEVLVRQSPQVYAFRLLLGACLSRVGRSEDAVRELKRAMEMAPDNPEAFQVLVYTANYLEYENPLDLFAYYRKYSELLEKPLAPLQMRHSVPANAGEAKRKLRVGFVSGDFCRHPVASFIEPVFEHYARERFEVVCYYNCPKSDAVTGRLKGLVDSWRDVAALPDDALAAQIREDAIDILVDLSGHTRLNRLLVFARKPAPVQVTMVGCMQTTGLESIDYRITDAGLDPLECGDACNSERLIRMETGAVCFKPYEDAPEPVPLPVLSGSPFTFGSFNNLAKITPRMLDLWAKILRQVPLSRMLLVADAGDYLVRSLEQRGVSRRRIEVLPRMQERDYLEAHNRVDLILDTYPFNGLTVSMNALWMGVPAVTLTGSTSASRTGAHLQRRLGLGELVVSSADAYVEKAVAQVYEPAYLAANRLEIRERMRSTWTDGAAYTRELESLFTRMWSNFTGPASGGPDATVRSEKREH